MVNAAPESLRQAAAIVADWAARQRSAAPAATTAVAVLDAVAALLPEPADSLRTALLGGDRRAAAALDELRALAPSILHDMTARLRELAGRGESQATLSRLPVMEALARAVDDPAALGEAEYLRGYTFRRLGQLSRAADAYRRALALGDDPAFRARTLSRLGNVQSDMSEFDAAAASYAASLALETDPAGKAVILDSVAAAMRSLGEFGQADLAVRQAATLRGASPKDGYALDAAAQSFSQLGDQAWALELSDRAKTWFMQSSPIGLPVNAEIRAMLLQAAGQSEEASLQFEAAIGLFDAQARESIDPAHYIAGWRRGVTTRAPLVSPPMLAYAAALKSGNPSVLAQAIALAEQAGDIALLLRARALRGGWLFDAGQFPQAVAELEDVLAQASDRGLALPEYASLLALASIAQSGGEVQRRPLEALCRARQLRDVMAGFLATLDLPPAEFAHELNDSGAIEHQLGQLATERKMWAPAAGFFEQAVARAKAVGDDFKLANRLAGLRLAAAKSADSGRADQAAADLRTLLAKKTLPDRGRIVAARALEAHDRTADPAAAHRWIEMAAKAAEALRAAAPPTQRETIDRQWNDVYWTLAQARREQGRIAEAFAAVQLGKARGLADRMLVRAAARENPPRLSTIQSRLGPGEALLDVALERGSLALYLVRPGGIDATAVPADPAKLLLPDSGDVHDRAAALLALARTDPALAAAAAWAEARLDSAARLFIAPDPRLANLPWHAIPWSTPRPIGVLPNASALFAPRRARTGRVLVMGDSRGDLPAARAECAAVAARYGVEPLVGAACSAAVLRGALAAGPLDILHIATHGRGNPRHGGMASLLLADASGAPLWTDLTALTSDDWRVGLVVLSGCSTGLVGRRDGAQTVSVADTVLRAGAGAVVACLWPVGDAAAQAAMEVFHRNFAATPDVLAALDAARAAPGAVIDTVRDGRSLPPTGPAPLDQALNQAAFFALGSANPLM